MANVLKEEKEGNCQITEAGTKILPFYRMKDLDELPAEITIDKFEEYASYRENCMPFQTRCYSCSVSFD
jgi:hypothetical protein